MVLFTGDESVGFCPDHLIPSSTECSPNYERVHNICVRVSPYALSWADAELKCMDEGGHLLQIMNEDVQIGVEFLIRSKLRSQMHFELDRWVGGISSTTEKFWIGGSVS